MKNGKDKIAVIAPCPFFIDRGTPIRIKRLATAMSGNFDIHVATYHLGREEGFPFSVHRIPNLPLKIDRVGANLTKFVADFFLFFKILSLIRRYDVRVIDGHLHEGAFLGLLAKWLTGRPVRVIYNAHGTFVPELIATAFIGEDSPLVKPLTRFERWVEKRVDAIVAQSVMRKKEFVNQGIPEEKIFVVEDVPELEALYLPDDRVDRDLERSLRPSGERLLIYSGSLETYQGVDFVLDAYRELCRRRRDVRLVLFGRPLPPYRRKAEEMGIADRIVFVEEAGFDRLPQYLKICDIGLSPRLYGENVPGKVPIYMASGICIVGTDVKGISSVLDHGRTGILVSPGDVEALVKALEDLLDHPEEIRRIGEAGREEAMRRYSPERARTVLGNLYRKLRDGKDLFVGAEVSSQKNT